MTELTQTHTAPSYGALAVSLVAANLLFGPADAAGGPVHPKITLTGEAASFGEHYSPFAEMNSPFAEMTLVPREQTSLVDFYAGLLSEQEELGPEFARVLYDNAWDLYAR